MAWSWRRGKEDKPSSRSPAAGTARCWPSLTNISGWLPIVWLQRTECHYRMPFGQHGAGLWFSWTDTPKVVMRAVTVLTITRCWCFRCSLVFSRWAIQHHFTRPNTADLILGCGCASQQHRQLFTVPGMLSAPRRTQQQQGRCRGRAARDRDCKG